MVEKGKAIRAVYTHWEVNLSEFSAARLELDAQTMFFLSNINIGISDWSKMENLNYYKMLRLMIGLRWNERIED